MLFKSIKTDARIIGAWLSDKELTTKDWVYPKPVVEEKMKKIENLFGKLRFKFTSAEIFSQYDEIEEKYSYKVVASDSESVVIQVTGKDGLYLQQWFFDGNDVMYVLSSRYIEYFRRISD